MTIGTLQAADIKLAQSGPGVAGTLAPVNGPTTLELQVERVDAYLYETETEFKAEYVIRNSSAGPVTETVGIPSLAVSTSSMMIAAIEGFAGDVPLVFFTRTEVLLNQTDYSPYLPLIQTFDLKRQWHTTEITVPPNGILTVTLLYNVPYLFKQEELEGRNEQSPRLLRFIRDYAVRWNGPVGRVALYFRPQVKQPEQLSFNPKPLREEQTMRIYEFDRRKPGAELNIEMVYDPVYFSVTPYGFNAPVPPLPLPPHRGRDFEYENLFDNNTKTAWCEGERRSAAGKGFEVEWGKQRWVDEVQIYAGDGANRSDYEARNRVRMLNAYLAKPGWTSKPIQIELKDEEGYQIFEMPKSTKATILILQILSVYPGESRDETCISELRPILRE